MRQRNTQVSVTLVGTDHQPTCFGDPEVHAGDADLAGEKLISQMLACGFGQVFRIGCSGIGAEVLVKRLTHFLFLDVNRRQHEMAGSLPAQLHNSLAQVRVDDLDAKSRDLATRRDTVEGTMKREIAGFRG